MDEQEWKFKKMLDEVAKDYLDNRKISLYVFERIKVDSLEAYSKPNPPDHAADILYVGIIVREAFKNFDKSFEHLNEVFENTDFSKAKIRIKKPKKPINIQRSHLFDRQETIKSLLENDNLSFEEFTEVITGERDHIAVSRIQH